MCKAHRSDGKKRNGKAQKYRRLLDRQTVFVVADQLIVGQMPEYMLNGESSIAY
jgi:hypothetical protein